MIWGCTECRYQHSDTKAWHAMAKFRDDDSAYMQPIHGSGT